MPLSFSKLPLLIALFFFPFWGEAQIITTIAGTGTAGYSGDGGLAVNAKINNPISVAADTAGNVFFGEQGSHVVRKINAATGIITTIAGNGASGNSGDGGQATNAQLYEPASVIMDVNENIYIADAQNNNIRKIDNSGIISTFAGGGG